MIDLFPKGSDGHSAQRSCQSAGDPCPLCPTSAVPRPGNGIFGNFRRGCKYVTRVYDIIRARRDCLLIAQTVQTSRAGIRCAL